jgi:ankyrin repeat protein
MAAAIAGCLIVAMFGAGLYRVHRRALAHDLVSAAIRGDGASVRRLLLRGADPNAARGGHSALWYAVTANHPRCARLLLEHGAVAPAEEAEARNELLMLTANERFGGIAPELPPAVQEEEAAAVVHLLLLRGADAGGADSDGDTALMWAAARGHVSVARVLLAAGARPFAKDRFGQTALAFAAAGGNASIVRALLAGEQPSVRERAARAAALRAARRFRRPEIVRILLERDRTQ